MEKELWFVYRDFERLVSLDFLLAELDFIHEEQQAQGFELSGSVTAHVGVPDSTGFWCQYYHEPFERHSGVCGSKCRGYKPRNGKSGICSHYSSCFATGPQIEITPSITPAMVRAVLRQWRKQQPGR